MQGTSTPPNATPTSTAACLGGEAGGMSVGLAGTDFLVDLGAPFLRVLGAADEGGPPAAKRMMGTAAKAGQYVASKAAAWPWGSGSRSYNSPATGALALALVMGPAESIFAIA